eukprot:354010-Chlamydomonas_euryale.AAC.4
MRKCCAWPHFLKHCGLRDLCHRCLVYLASTCRPASDVSAGSTVPADAEEAPADISFGATR